MTPTAILVDGNGILHSRGAGIACFLGVRTGLSTIGVGKTLYCHDGLTKQFVLNNLEKKLNYIWEQWKVDKNSITISDQFSESENLIVVDSSIDVRSKDSHVMIDAESTERRNSLPLSLKDKLCDMKSFCIGFAAPIQGESGTIWAMALLGHGGCMGRAKSQSGTTNPIFVSIGHKMGLIQSTRICAELSLSRIPEPVRTADLLGRKILRDKYKSNH